MEVVSDGLANSISSMCGNFSLRMVFRKVHVIMKLSDCKTLKSVQKWFNFNLGGLDRVQDELLVAVLHRAAQIGWERGVKDAADYVDGPEGQPEHMIYEDLGSEIREIPLPDDFKGE